MAPPQRFAESLFHHLEHQMIYNDLAHWDSHAQPAALGCRGWFTARVTTLGELDAALDRAAAGESASKSRSSETGWTSRRGSPWPTNTSMPCTGMVSASGNDAGPSGRAPSPFRFQNHSTDHRLG